MKYLILSDIHGSLTSLDKALGIYCSHGCDMLLLLGDLLNYGPRNGLPENLDAMGVAERLNTLSGDIVAVRGNCDSEVDQMLLRFPIMQDAALIVDDGVRLWLTHGHVYNADRLPSPSADVLFCGHTHLWSLSTDARGTVVCNTGSPTFPKGGNPPALAIYDSGIVSILDLQGNVLATEKVKRKNT